MSILDFLLGRPLSSREEQGQRIAVLAGIAIFGLDALSSAAYGPEAALTVVRPLGALGNQYLVPISLLIIALLTIVFFSYRQTIAAYPGGGGSYTVARENLGSSAGLLAGSALMIDYILNVAVGISAGVGALVSAAPSLQPHTLLLCLGILAAITLINLRGLREAGLIFMAPTYLFVGSLLLARARAGTKPPALDLRHAVHRSGVGQHAWRLPARRAVPGDCDDRCVFRVAPAGGVPYGGRRGALRACHGGEPLRPPLPAATSRCHAGADGASRHRLEQRVSTHFRGRRPVSPFARVPALDGALHAGGLRVAAPRLGCRGRTVPGLYAPLSAVRALHVSAACDLRLRVSLSGPRRALAPADACARLRSVPVLRRASSGAGARTAGIRRLDGLRHRVRATGGRSGIPGARDLRPAHLQHL